jgi:hypothetical protein
MCDGRDIGGEAWAAKGWKPKINPSNLPPMLASYAEQRSAQPCRCSLHVMESPRVFPLKHSILWTESSGLRPHEVGTLELISAHEALEFLGKSAPRPWVKRMLLWMICTRELAPYFLGGKSIAKCLALGAVFQDVGSDVSAEIARTTVESRFSPKLADLIRRAGDRGYVKYITHEWGESDDGPQIVSPGYFLRADNIDWKNGIVQVEVPMWDNVEQNYFNEEEDLLTSEFDKADYKITLVGLSFDREAIEMLQPNVDIGPAAAGQTESRARIGRPRTWDWDGATTYLLSVAQTPDGLPTGPGAQAQIERLISEWFTNDTGDAPAASQIRQHATKIMRALKKPESR